MSANFFISLRPRINGSHLVHKEGCPLLPDTHTRICLGMFESPEDALNEGKKFFERSDICPFCCKKYQTQMSNTGSSKMHVKENFVSSGQIVVIRESALIFSLN